MGLERLIVRTKTVYVSEARPLYEDRHDAGRRLAEDLAGYAGGNAFVLAVPRGGVPVALEAAERLGLSLDVLVVRKIPIPSEPEAGYGAVADDGTVVLNDALARRLAVTDAQVRRQAAEVKAEIDRRIGLYRGNSPFPSLEDRAAILVDDGLASGFTMIAAIRSVRRRGARGVVVAVPVASHTAVQKVQPLVDEVVCPFVSIMPWFAVASFYRHWYDLSDSEVTSLLGEWRRRHSGASGLPEQAPAQS